MGCVVVCAAGAGALDGVAAVALMALGFAVAAALAAAVMSVLAGFLPVVVPVFLAVCLALSWPTVRLVQHGSTADVFRRHRRPVERCSALEAAPVQAALPAGSSLRALEAAPVLTGVIVIEEEVNAAMRQMRRDRECIPAPATGTRSPGRAPHPAISPRCKVTTTRRRAR